MVNESPAVGTPRDVENGMDQESGQHESSLGGGAAAALLTQLPSASTLVALSSGTVLRTGPSAVSSSSNMPPVGSNFRRGFSGSILPSDAMRAGIEMPEAESDEEDARPDSKTD